MWNSVDVAGLGSNASGREVSCGCVCECVCVGRKKEEGGTMGSWAQRGAALGFKLAATRTGHNQGSCGWGHLAAEGAPPS